jgi:membrane-bound lytic murein transglycosylase D
MNRLIMRFWLLPAIAFVLNACSSIVPTVKSDKTIAYRTITQPRTAAPPQNFNSSTTHSGVFQKPGDIAMAYRTITQPRTAPPQNFYRSATHSGVFQKPGELETAVEFWRKTYAVWHRSEVAFHDDRYLDVIYEVMVLPGDVDECLTSEQKEMVNQRRDYWKAQLAVLESKSRYNNAPLNANDRQMIAKLASSGRQLNSVLNGAAERVRSQRGTRERFKHGIEISRRYDRQFRKIFSDAGLPEDLAYLPHVESSFQPAAKSSAGAVGMWQFTKAAAQTFMPAGDRFDQRLDPFASAIGTAHYLSYAYSKLGDWPTAITSFNHGIGGMKRAQDQVGRDFVRIVQTYAGPAFGFASRNYYAQFLAAREIASDPMQYFPEGVQYEFPLEPSQNLAAGRSHYFCKSFFGHPCPTSGKKYATANVFGGPRRPASHVAYPTRGMQHSYAMTRRDFVKPAFSLRKKLFVKTHALSLLRTTRLLSRSEQIDKF